MLLHSPVKLAWEIWFHLGSKSCFLPQRGYWNTPLKTSVLTCPETLHSMPLQIAFIWPSSPFFMYWNTKGEKSLAQACFARLAAPCILKARQRILCHSKRFCVDEKLWFIEKTYNQMPTWPQFYKKQQNFWALDSEISSQAWISAPGTEIYAYVPSRGLVNTTSSLLAHL